MKVLFAHDHIFLTKDEKVYSNTFSYEILQRYVDVFDEVTIVARQCEVDDSKEVLLANGAGVRFVFLESVASVKSHFGLRQAHEKKLEKLVKAHDGLIVKLPSEFGIMAAKIARKDKKKYLAEVVGCAWDAMWNYGGVRSKLYAPYLYTSMKYCVKNADAVSYVTERFLQERYPASKDARAIGLSDVSLPKHSDDVLIQRRKKIDAMDGKIRFGTIANLDLHYKGIDVAITTLCEISKTYKDFEYHVVGAGDPSKYKALAKELGIEDKVFFEGTLSGRNSVFRWLDSVDIYLQPSFQEGLPRALIEAMSRGCAAAGSNVGGIPELLDRGMIFRHTYVKEFQQIILSLVEDKALMLDEAKRNFDRVKKYESSVLDEKRKDFWAGFSYPL